MNSKYSAELAGYCHQLVEIWTGLQAVIAECRNHLEDNPEARKEFGKELAKAQKSARRVAGNAEKRLRRMAPDFERILLPFLSEGAATEDFLAACHEFKIRARTARSNRNSALLMNAFCEAVKLTSVEPR